MSKKIGLVMTGGGARAGYQVGVVRAIQEIVGKKENLFHSISGNSAGGINSVYLAANARNWDVATENLKDLWIKLKPQNIFDLRGRTLTDLGLRWISGTVFGGMTPKGSSVNHLLDTAPLRKLVLKEMDFSHIHENIKDGYLHGIALSTTNYNSGSNVVFYDGADSIKDWSRSDRFSCRTRLNVEHMMASAAIPIFFPPIKINESYFGDGCIRQTTPLSPSIHLGADKILAIGIRHPREREKVKTLSFASIPEPTMGQISGVMLNAIFLDSLDADIERLSATNKLIAEGQNQNLKSIPLLTIRPSKDLGEMSTDISSELPSILRYLLKGIGVSGTEGLDLLSYLAFDKSYTKPLIELGYEDTYRVKKDVLDFFNDDV